MALGAVGEELDRGSAVPAGTVERDALELPVRIIMASTVPALPEQ
jgi:hypothetical protein